MDSSKVAQLKLFVQQCEANPAVLQDPQLRFFRNYLEKLEAKLPSSAYGKGEFSKGRTTDDLGEDSDDDMPELEEQSGAARKEGGAHWEEHVSDEEVESELELDLEGVVPPDHDPPQKMGDQSIEVTEEMRDNAQVAKAKALEATAAGDLDEAVNFLTEAILSNPTSAILYATRAGVYVKMKKPNAAIRDAEAAIKINPDSAKGYKWRGEAKALLGLWEEAAKDLHLASRLDYDEEIAAVLKKVEPNAHKIEEHRRKYERLHKEREERKVEREKQRRRAEAQAAYEKAKKEQEKASPRPRPGGAPGGFPGGMPGGFPGGMPGGFPGGMPGSMPGGFPGGMPGGGFPGSSAGGMPGGIDMSKILNDPELLTAFQDPEVMAALQDVMKNPANLAKHQGNPKVAPIIAKMMSKFGGSGR
ncbi:hypothetical protein O6H91_11G001300 [Diphasiastrum complanatum]|uniref:Uncharacterized protein n=1 Tax=Diphasiastrum complanatum TaxID=34168 RepID=A0ACC2C5R7_DIPCM|nr:hypothetical protein O6H91_11G001300 [Diphasiastrum complanatum]